MSPALLMALPNHSLRLRTDRWSFEKASWPPSHLVVVGLFFVPPHPPLPVVTPKKIPGKPPPERESTSLKSRHRHNSYARFCFEKKKSSQQLGRQSTCLRSSY